MKVLILSVTAGQGHHSTGKAVMEYFNSAGACCKMIDTYEYISPIISESISKGYLLSTQYSPAVYGQFYKMFEHKEKSESRFTFSRISNSIIIKKIEHLIDEFLPDVIIATHIFSAHIATLLAELYNNRFVTVGIVTDFTIHPFWEDTCLDYYVTASHLLNNQISKKGIEVEKVLPFGIPIDKKFSSKVSKQQARQKLGIEDKRTLLVMGGSMGYGNLAKVVYEIAGMELDFQILCVCGNNKLLKKRIDKIKSDKKIYSYGFVDNVDVMMDATDVIITKPGGLTVSESLAKGVPLILIKAIPGQEERNVDFLLNNGLALNTSKTFAIDEAIYHMFHNDWRERTMPEGVKYIGKPNATRDLCDFILGKHDCKKDGAGKREQEPSLV